MMNTKLHTLMAACVLLAVPCMAQKSPNIVMIMADDLGGRDLPVYGNRFNEAPHIDRLAKQGMLFHNAYAAPVCSATRASIQSGQYPARVGIFDFIPGHWRPYEEVNVPHHKVQHLPDDIVTLGDVMQEAGYKTGYFGKWHLGRNAKRLPDARGYDAAHIYAGGGFYKPKFVPAYKAEKGQRLSDTLTGMGIEFMKENQEEPFFLFVSHYDVHVQLDADRDLIDKYLKKETDSDYSCNAVYAAMIEHVDKSVGEMMQAVEDLGLADNTIFIFYLAFPLKRLLGELQEFLIKRQLTTNQFTVKLSHRGHPSREFSVFLANPDNDAQMFLMLSQLQLEKVNDMPEVDNISIAARNFFEPETKK